MQMHCTGTYWCDFYQWAPGAARLENVPYEETWWDEVEPQLAAFFEEYDRELERCL
jgi:hypothetical protein